MTLIALLTTTLASIIATAADPVPVDAGSLAVSPEIIFATPVIIALMWGFRSAGLPSRWTPLTAIGVGLAVAVLLVLFAGAAALPTLVGGAMAGAGAVGFHAAATRITPES